jgi:amylosucrase
MVFMRNDATGDARICGSLASLAGLEAALENADTNLITAAVNRILLLHSLILSFGGIPLLYNGDALGVVNDYSYRDDPSKSSDNRWIHRPKINWERAGLRKKQGTVEYILFNAMKKMIAIRKETSAFADFNNRELLEVNNEHLLCFIRFNFQRPSERVLVVANFDATPQYLDLDAISGRGINLYGHFIDLYSGKSPTQYERRIVLQAYQFYWLTET